MFWTARTKFGEKINKMVIDGEWDKINYMIRSGAISEEALTADEWEDVCDVLDWV